MSTLKAGQVAKATGVGVETLRYYEREGLLKEPPRRESGYRQYPEKERQKERKQRWHRSSIPSVA
jgi:DNA-binding transcriptional MerR regulator